MSIALILKLLAVLAVLMIIVVGGNLLYLYLQLGRYQRYWTAKNQETMPDGAEVYIALGDSAAQGIGATSPKKGYVGLIAETLGKHSGRPVHVINLSKSGAKVSDVLNTQIPKLQQIPQLKTATVTIEIGANDMIQFDAKKFEQDIDQLFIQLPPQTVISDVPYFGSAGRYRNKQPNVEQANEIMYRLAKQHGRELVPLYERTKQNGALSTFAADWFHPSDRGYRENWYPVFMERLSD